MSQEMKPEDARAMAEAIDKAGAWDVLVKVVETLANRGPDQTRFVYRVVQKHMASALEFSRDLTNHAIAHKQQERVTEAAADREAGELIR